MYPISRIILSYDNNVDWFPSKMMLDYNNERLEDLPHYEYLRRREKQIMGIIWANSENGIHHGDLARKVGINRKNLAPYMRRLIMKGLVVRSIGKQGKYYPSTKENRDTFVTANILGEAVASHMLEGYKSFPIDSPYFNNKITNDISPLDHALLIFSNGIGAIITYLLIQSMNPSFDIPGRDAKSGKDKDINVNRWFIDAISALRDILLPLFKQYISCPLILSNKNYANEDGTIDLYGFGIDFLKQILSPSYIYDEKYAARLNASLFRTYPDVYSYLDWVKSRLPVGVFWETNHREYEKISQWYQKKCRHKYTLPSNKSLSTKYKNNLLHCSRCHKNKYIKNPFLS
jgi:predicted transcriptional regulator